MRFGKGVVLAAIITLAVIILNGAVFYSVYSSGDVLQSRDVYGNEYQSNRSDIIAQQSLIDSLTGNKNEAAAYLENNISLLEDYLAAAEYIAGNANSLNEIDGEKIEDRRETAEELYVQYTANMQSPDPDAVSQQISAEIAKYTAVLSKVEYALNYDGYIDEVISNAQSLTDMDILKSSDRIIHWICSLPTLCVWFWITPFIAEKLHTVEERMRKYPVKEMNTI